ncbi:TPA: hypothetical protein I8235_000969 [Kluyvera intermedia]|nr:hypothetical protein [Kluyvera intermedia]
MRRVYDLPIDPLARTAHMISLVELMNDILATESDTRDEYLDALLGMLGMAMRDLHSLLEGNECPENKNEQL